MPLNLKHGYTLSFLVAGFALVVYTYYAPIADFGNYYYASKLFSEQKFSVEDYKSIHHFNEQIKAYGEQNFFENYTPVPPFSILFYLPLVLFKSTVAKLVFNVFSLLIFCVSLQRLTRFRKLNSVYLWLLPLFVINPLFSCILQGQSYLLISSLLIESYIAHEKKHILLSAFFFSLTICLKIFTGFLFIYFLLKRDVRHVLYSLLSITLLILLTSILTSGIVYYYIGTVLPRLSVNEILEPYHYSSQSFHSFLMKLFSQDAQQNPKPLLDSPMLMILIESLFLAFLLSATITIFNKIKRDSWMGFSFMLFVALLFTKHSAGYSLLLILPFCVAITAGLPFSDLQKFFIFILVTLAVNIPPSLFSQHAAPLQFLRLWFLITIFLVIFLNLKTRINFKFSFFALILFFAWHYSALSKNTNTYFSHQNSKGALFDYCYFNDTLKLTSCYGDHDLTEIFGFKGKITEDPELTLREDKLFYRNKMICGSADTKLKPMLLNDTSVLFLSDMKQGVGFYKLQVISLRK